MSDDYLLPDLTDPDGGTGDSGRMLGIGGLLRLVGDESALAFSAVVVDGSNTPPSAVPMGLDRARMLLCYGVGGFSQQLAEELRRKKGDLSSAILSAAGSSSAWTSADEAVRIESLQACMFPPRDLHEGAQAGDEWINFFGTVFCWCPPGKLPHPEDGAGGRPGRQPMVSGSGSTR